MAIETIEENPLSPEKKVENALWEFGMNNPECRLAIARVVALLSSNTKKNTALAEISTDQHVLTKLRTERKMTQKKLAEITGISPSNICRMEAGAIKITNKSRLKIAKALNIDPEALY